LNGGGEPLSVTLNGVVDTKMKPTVEVRKSLRELSYPYCRRKLIQVCT
jgi:hypothetical protein